jgi:hypothetical protein
MEMSLLLLLVLLRRRLVCEKLLALRSIINKGRGAVDWE